MVATMLIGYALSGFWFLLLLTYWAAVAFWVAHMAKGKGHDFWGWFAVSLFFWWITLFVVISLSDRNQPERPAVLAQG
jgi:hypothetical protein